MSAWDAAKSPGENAAAVLPGLAQEYFEAGDKGAREQSTPAELHAFRLATKRFRYTLELFEPVYGPGLEAKLKTLRRVQQLLGEMSDCESVRRLGRRDRQLVEWLDRRSQTLRRQFLQYWRREFVPAASRKKWLLYLKKQVKKT